MGFMAWSKEQRAWGSGGMEEWKSGRLEWWKVGRVEEWKDGGMEWWRDGKGGRMEGWRFHS